MRLIELEARLLREGERRREREREGERGREKEREGERKRERKKERNEVMSAFCLVVLVVLVVCERVR